MIYASYDHNMLAFEVFLSFSFLFRFFVSFFLCLQKLYIHRYLWEKLFFVHLHPYTRQTFSIHTHIKNSFPLYPHKNSIPVQRFLFRFSTYTRGLYKNFFIYTHYSHTRISFRTISTHTQNLSIHFLHIKNSFLFFIYRHDVCSQCLFLFSILGVIMIFVHFIFRTTFLKENSTRFQNFNKHYRQ